MTVADKLERELNRLQPLDGKKDSSQRLSIDINGGRIDCELTAIEPIACAFRRFSLTTDKLADVSQDDLKQLSQSLASRLGYLLEPIRLIEIDPDGSVVQMRSDPPLTDEQSTSYYELLACRGGELTLCRYCKVNGKDRRVVPAIVTREVLAKLATDFVGAIA